MSLASDFSAALQAAVGQTSLTICVVEGLRSVRCEVVQCDALAVAVMGLTLETTELAAVDVAKLQSASQSLCNRVTYLLEPISPIEIDADRCTVQMRSSPPQKDDNARRYYELLLRRGGAVSLHRYEKQPAATRTNVPATLTHEVLGRLVEDFSATVDEILQS